MPEAVPVGSVLETLEAAIAAWHTALDLSRSTSIDEALRDAPSSDAHLRVRRRLEELAAESEASSRRLRELVHTVDARLGEWRELQRYTEAGLAALARDLERSFGRAPALGARRWLLELLQAARAAAWDAVDRLAGMELPFPDDLHEGARLVRSAIRSWRDAGDEEAGMRLATEAAGGALPGWGAVLRDEIPLAAHRLAGWIALRRLDDLDRAREHLDAVVDGEPRSARAYADRAALFGVSRDLDRMSADAQRAIELAPRDPDGHLRLGTWAELSGHHADADELYRRGLDHLSNRAIRALRGEAALCEPTGRLLLAAGDVLLARRDPAAGLEALDAAILAVVRGPSAYPDADVHRLRSQALEQLGLARDAAAAALEAGKQYAWADDAKAATAALERSVALHEIEEAGWRLVAAYVWCSWPSGQQVPDRDLVARAHRTWDGCVAKFGLPRGSMGWAYLARADIADSEAVANEANAVVLWWEALCSVERALVHDDSNPTAWGMAARYIRLLQLPEVALEAVEQGYELARADQQILLERLAQQATKGRFEEAGTTGEELERLVGAKPWVSGARAFVAYYRGRFDEALGLLEQPIEAGLDLAYYYELRARCHLALGAIDAARDDYRALRDEATPISGISRCQFAIACAALQDRVAASSWLRAARDDASTPEFDYHAAAGYLALAADDVGGAESELAAAARAARSAAEADALIQDTRVMLRVLDDRGADDREAVLRRVERGAAAERAAELRRRPPSADAEMADQLRELPSGALDARATALLAVASRRHARAGRLEEAAAGYERLRAGDRGAARTPLEARFEPEATIALGATLARLSDARTERGDVDGVAEAQRGLAEIGVVSPVQVELAVAAAVEATGETRAARERLNAVAAGTPAGEEEEEVRIRLAGLALADGDLSAARVDLEAALTSAERRDAAIAIAQLQTRLGVVSLLEREPAEAERRLQIALDHWRRGGAVDPVHAILDDVGPLLRAAPAGMLDAAIVDRLAVAVGAMGDSPGRAAQAESILADLRRDASANPDPPTVSA